MRYFKLRAAAAIVAGFCAAGAMAATTATGEVTVEVESENIIELPTTALDFGTLTVSQLQDSTARSRSTDMKIYTTASTPPTGGLSTTFTFASYDTSQNLPYLSVGSSTSSTAPDDAIFYNVSITPCNGGTETSVTGGSSPSPTPTVVMTSNISASDCTTSAGSLKITLQQLGSSSIISTGTYESTINISVGST